MVPVPHVWCTYHGADFTGTWRPPGPGALWLTARTHGRPPWCYRYLLQYPLTPSYRQVPTPTSAKMKPKHQLLEVDVPVPGPPHLDEEAEGRTNVRTMRMASTGVPAKANTMIGVVHDGGARTRPMHLRSARSQM